MYVELWNLWQTAWVLALLGSTGTADEWHSHNEYIDICNVFGGDL